MRLRIRGGLAVLGGAICLISPIALFALTLAYGATEWRDADEPLPWPVRIMDGLFLSDLVASLLLVWLADRWWWLG